MATPAALQSAARISERALHAGAQAGLEALAHEALQLSGASGARLLLGRGRSLYQAGTLPPAARETVGVQWLKAGALRLALRTPGLSPAQREQLEPLLRLVPALLAAREREAQARAHAAALRSELRSHVERSARLEAHRSRASHDLRTPLLVMKGYVDMIQRGLAGPPSPTLRRYAERIAAAVEQQNALISQHLTAERGPVAPLLPALRSALEARPGALTLHATEQDLRLRARRSQLTLLARTLVAVVGTSPGGSLEVAPLQPSCAGGPVLCRIHLCLPAGRVPAPRPLCRLRALAAALAGELELGPGTLTLRLPRAD